MIRIIDQRATGKTEKLMLLAKEHNAIIVCSNPLVMREKAYRYGITGLDFISYEDYTSRNHQKDRPFLIDELECYVQSVGSNLLGYTLSKE